MIHERHRIFEIDSHVLQYVSYFFEDWFSKWYELILKLFFWSSLYYNPWREQKVFFEFCIQIICEMYNDESEQFFKRNSVNNSHTKFLVLLGLVEASEYKNTGWAKTNSPFVNVYYIITIMVSARKTQFVGRSDVAI